MNPGGVLLALFLLAISGLSVATLAVAVRGGRGPGDPPASHRHVDPNGFPVLSRPRGLLDTVHRRRSRAGGRGVLRDRLDRRPGQAPGPGPGAIGTGTPASCGPPSAARP